MQILRTEAKLICRAQTCVHDQKKKHIDKRPLECNFRLVNTEITANPLIYCCYRNLIEGFHSPQSSYRRNGLAIAPNNGNKMLPYLSSKRPGVVLASHRTISTATGVAKYNENLLLASSPREALESATWVMRLF